MSGSALSTREEQQSYFEAAWPRLRAALEGGGAEALIAAIDDAPTTRAQRVLYSWIREGVVKRDWSGKNLDAYIEVADAGIARILAHAEAADDALWRDKLLDTANVISGNLAADLCDCWPDDDLERTPAHFERGLAASDQCLEWRHQLDKGPWPFLFAWWTKGFHELRLGRVAAARISLTTSLDLARIITLDSGAGTALESTSDVGLLIAAGYAYLAAWSDGDDTGRDGFGAVCKILKRWQGVAEQRDEADFALGQLEITRSRLSLSDETDGDSAPDVTGRPDGSEDDDHG